MLCESRRQGKTWVLRGQGIRNGRARVAQKTKAGSEQQEPAKKALLFRRYFFRGNSALGIVGRVQAVEQFIRADHFPVTRTRISANRGRIAAPPAMVTRLVSRVRPTARS